MGEIIELPKTEDSASSLIDSGILSGEKYKEQRALLQQFLERKILKISNPASKSQARAMAENIGMELPPTAADLYEYMRSLTTPFSDQAILDEVLRLTNNEKRDDFRKFYSNIFTETADKRSDELSKTA